MTSKKKRPYLAYELDAFENAFSIATSAGIPVEKVTHGNLTLWRHVWRTRSVIVTTAHIIAFFGSDATGALVLFNHLEPVDGGWRVKGAEEWLRVLFAQSEAGKKNAGNLRRGAEAGPNPSRLHPENGAKPGISRTGSLPALPASSQQPAASSSLEASAGKKPPAPPKPPDPRHAPLVKALCEATPEYTFAGGRDAKAVTALLTLGEPDEVVRRWLRAWGRTGYPTVRTLSELVTHWNHFATAGPAVAPAPLEKHTKTGRLEL